MIVIRSRNRVLIKREHSDIACVYIGVLRSWFYLPDGTKQDIVMNKPHDDYTIAECRTLLNDLHKLCETRQLVYV